MFPTVPSIKQNKNIYVTEIYFLSVILLLQHLIAHQNWKTKTFIGMLVFLGMFIFDEVAMIWLKTKLLH